MKRLLVFIATPFVFAYISAQKQANIIQIEAGNIPARQTVITPFSFTKAFRLLHRLLERCEVIFFISKNFFVSGKNYVGEKH